MNASQEQVGGSHYKDMAIQPVDFIYKNGLGYLEGNVIKYVARHKKKGGKQDLEKAKHYIDLLIQQEYPNEMTVANLDVETPGYRMLNTSDIVKLGDQVLVLDDKWVAAKGSIGLPVEPAQIGCFRRPIKHDDTPVLDAKSFAEGGPN